MTNYYIAVDYDRYDIDCSGRALSVVGTDRDEVVAEATVKYQLVECIVAEPCTELLYREVLERGAPRDYGYEKTNLLCTTPTSSRWPRRSTGRSDPRGFGPGPPLKASRSFLERASPPLKQSADGPPRRFIHGKTYQEEFI